MKIPLFLLFGSLMLLAAETTTAATPPMFNTASQITALSVLAAVVWYLLTKTIPRLSKTFTDTLNTLCERWDRWEKTRHDDSEELNRTLRELAANVLRKSEE